LFGKGHTGKEVESEGEGVFLLSGSGIVLGGGVQGPKDKQIEGGGGW